MSFYYGTREVLTGTIDRLIDATDRFEIAQALAFVDDKRAIGDFEAERFELVFVDEAPADEVAYVYELEGAFDETDTPHRFVSKGPTRIVKITMTRPSDVPDLWRVASEEERTIIDAASDPDTV